MKRINVCVRARLYVDYLFYSADNKYYANAWVNARA